MKFAKSLKSDRKSFQAQLKMEDDLNRCKIPGENFGKLIEYKTVRMDNIKGIEQAEKLVKAGWKQGQVSLFSTQYFRYVEG